MADAWADFREQMPVTRRWAYFNHAAVAPLTGPAAEAIAAWLKSAVEQGGNDWLAWNQQLAKVRELAAGLVNAGRDEIALVHSTTEGISLVAEGLPWREGENVVTLADEFPSNLYPWMNLASRGVETRRVPTDRGRVDFEAFEAACDGKTRIISMSWIGYALGWRHDIARAAELAHRHGALFFLDAIQGLGAFPLDVQAAGIDFFAADGHKWMLGPEGAGLLYVRREHLDRLRPLGVGWNSVVHSNQYDRIELKLKPSAERYEGGSPNSVGFIGLHHSLGLLARYGLAAIGERILEVTDLACEKLARAGAEIVTRRDEPDRRSGIVAFDWPGHDPQAVRRHCLTLDVVLGCRAGHLRISPHAYCNEQDLDRLVDALRSSGEG